MSRFWTLFDCPLLSRSSTLSTDTYTAAPTAHSHQFTLLLPQHCATSTLSPICRSSRFITHRTVDRPRSWSGRVVLLSSYPAHFRSLQLVAIWARYCDFGLFTCYQQSPPTAFAFSVHFGPPVTSVVSVLLRELPVHLPHFSLHRSVAESASYRSIGLAVGSESVGRLVGRSVAVAVGTFSTTLELLDAL